MLRPGMVQPEMNQRVRHPPAQAASDSYRIAAMLMSGLEATGRESRLLAVTVS